MLLHTRRPIFAIALMGLAAALLTLPSTASADRADRRTRAENGDRRDGQREDQRADRRSDQRADHRSDQRADRRSDYRSGHRDRGLHRGHRHHYKARRGAHVKHVSQQRHHEAPFYCKPCRHRFASRDGFRRHLHHHHRVPLWRLSRAIVHHTLGWVFFG